MALELKLFSAALLALTFTMLSDCGHRVAPAAHEAGIIVLQSR